jgi:hypothetical protein
MGTSGARSTSSALDHDPTTKITDAEPAGFLRLLRFLRLDPPHWGANQSVQRTGASRHAEWRCGRSRWLAPVADLQRSLSPADQSPNQMISTGHWRNEGQVRAAYQPEADHDHRCGGEPRLAWPAFPAATLTPLGSEPDGPANGSQPARRVALRASPVAGSRR